MGAEEAVAHTPPLCQGAVMGRRREGLTHSIPSYLFNHCHKHVNVHLVNRKKRNEEVASLVIMPEL